MRTVVYTAEIDDRFGAGKVSSRIGLSSPARLYNPQTSLFDDIAAEHQLKPIHCVLVDESQFLTREQVHELSKLSIRWIFRCFMGCGRTFAVSSLPAASIYWHWSDKLVELKTICFCGRKMAWYCASIGRGVLIMRVSRSSSAVMSGTYRSAVSIIKRR